MRTKQLAVLGLTYVCYAAVYANRKPFSLVKSSLAKLYGFEVSRLGMVDTSFMAAYSAGQFFMPSIAAVYFTPSTYLAGCFIASGISMSLFAMTTSIPLYILLNGINGLAQSSCYCVFVRAFTAWIYPNQRGLVLGIWCTSGQAGSVIATIACSYLTYKVGWRAGVLAPGLAIVPLGIIMYFLLPSPESGKQYLDSIKKEEEIQDDEEQQLLSTEAEEEEAIEGFEKRNAIGMKQVLRSGDIMCLVVSYFCFKCTRYTMLLWLPFYVATALDYPIQVAGNSSMYFDLGAVIGSIAVGYVLDKVFVGRRILCSFLFTLLTAGALLLVNSLCSSGPVTMCVTLGIIGVIIGIPDSIIGASGTADAVDRARIHPDNLSIAAGLVNGAGAIGVILQGATTPVVLENYGWNTVYTMLSVCAVASSLSLIYPLILENKSIRRRV